MKVLFFLLGFLSAPFASAAEPSLATPAKITESPEALTTDRVWDLDSGVMNPHRVFFAVRRDVTFDGLEITPFTDGKFGAQGGVIHSNLTFAVRPAGAPIYRPVCGKSAAPMNPEIARVGARVAAEEWDPVVGAEEAKLGVLLHRLRGDSADQAKRDADLIFQAWLRDTTAKWRVRSADAAARAEEKAVREFSRQNAAFLREHPPGAAENCAPPGWEPRMEGLPPPPEKPFPLPITRAPARRWDGAFSVRALLEAAGEKPLDGQFLLDSATPETIVAPDWLRGQGLLPEVIEVTAAFEHARFTGGQALDSGDPSPRGEISKLTLGGLVLPIRDVLVHDTELYAPPENTDVCCGGILGLDFLQHYVVQFRTGDPNEIVIWPRQNFHPAWTDLAHPVWIAASVTATGQVVSACELKTPNGRETLPGVLWDTAASVGIEAHAPWRNAIHRRWDLVCDGQPGPLAQDVAPETESESSPFAREKMPAATLGVPLLARGPFILDLPHGRIWFSQDDFAKPVRSNESGLTVTFDYLDGNRILKVLSIRGGKEVPAAALLKAGLRVGSVITEVDGQPTDALDLWEVDRRLAGARSDRVALRWVSAKGKGPASQATMTLRH